MTPALFCKRPWQCSARRSSTLWWMGTALLLAVLGEVALAQESARTSFPPATPRAATGVDDTFVRTWSNRAQAAADAGEWSLAADCWEILALALPKESSYRARSIQALTRAEAVAAEHTRRGDELRRQGDLQRAMRHYLTAVAALPDSAEALAALRQLGRQMAFDEPGAISARAKPSRRAGAAPSPAMTPR